MLPTLAVPSHVFTGRLIVKRGLIGLRTTSRMPKSRTGSRKGKQPGGTSLAAAAAASIETLQRDKEPQAHRYRPSPLQNRVTPWGDVVAVPQRYHEPSAMIGNRGILHDGEYRVVRPYALKAWLGCKLRVERTRRVQRDDNRAFNGRKRILMTPGRYTELFFLDEATAMAAGHRPCACCRRKDYTAFMAAIHASGPERSTWSAPQLDEALQAERLREKDPGCRGHTSSKRLHTAELGTLPDGVMLALDEAAQDAWLLWKGALHRWSHDGYTEPRPLPAAAETNVHVLTPPTLVAALAAGFEPQPPHESARQP